MQPDGRARRGERVAPQVRPPRPQDAGKQIAHSAQRHGGIPRAVLVDAPPVRRHDQRVRALQNDRGVVPRRQCMRSARPVRGDFLAPDAQQSRRLAFMRRQHELLPRNGRVRIRLRIPAGQNRQRVRVQHESSRTARQDPRKYRLRVQSRRKPHAGDGDVRLRRHAGKRKLRERRFGNMHARGDPRCVRHDKLHKSRACGPRTQRRNHGRMDVMARTADYRHGSDRVFRRSKRANRKRTLYLTRNFHVLYYTKYSGF